MAKRQAIAPSLFSGVMAALAVVLFGVPDAAWAQRSRDRVKLNTLKFYDRKTPKFQDYSDPRAVAKNYWMQIMVEYTAEGGRDGWIDEVTLEWHVLFGGRRTILLRKTVSYIDVEAGKHRAVVYLRPGFIRRFGKNGRIGKRDLRVLVAARVNGALSDTIFYPSGRVRTKWWELKPPRVMLRPGELMSRDETPFAPLDYDYYEQLKPRTAGP
ncbi:MAG: hypothetical protein GXP31_01950 [Kiritimatiellaeota bacterium]|nr:hypothetical protein [Kiritimatiellota bacterium]